MNPFEYQRAQQPTEAIDAMSRHMRAQDAVTPLEETLREEKAADAKLTEIGKATIPKLPSSLQLESITRTQGRKFDISAHLPPWYPINT